MSRPDLTAWEERFSTDGYVFGTEPNEFLRRSAHLIPAGARVLVVADGEGRNGVWLAAHGYAVHATEASPSAIAKSVRLAAERGVREAASTSDLVPGSIAHDRVDLLEWGWPVGAYDAVVGIFIQFARPDARRAMFAGMAAALRPGGILLLEGYHVRQLQFGTGGPRDLEQLYDAEILRTSFPLLDIVSIDEHDVHVDEGPGHQGMSAVIDLVATKPTGP